MLTFDQSYRKDLKYPDPLKSGFYRGYGHPTKAYQPATRDWHAIKAILIHTTNNPHGNTAYPQEARFLRDSASVSINYVCSSHDHTIVEVLPPAFIAWHAGDCQDNAYENLYSIGVEISWTINKGPLPQIAIDNVTRLVRQLLEWYPWITKIDMHRSQAYPKGRKIDPSGWSDKDFYAWRSGIFGSAAPTQITEDDPIISPARATEAQCATYILARDHKNYSDYDIRDIIVPAYVRICEPVGIDPLGAIAQGLQEGWPTSFWGRRPQRNPAGIGVDGDHSYDPDEGKALSYIFNPDRQRWEDGVSFATWEKDAIPAHIGRLVAYALPASRWSKAQHDLVSYALDYRSLTTKAWGSGPTYKTLGAKHNLANVGLPREKWVAGWAWDGADYGAKIAAIMNAIRGL